jgi:hypothetical protein
MPHANRAKLPPRIGKSTTAVFPTSKSSNRQDAKKSMFLDFFFLAPLRLGGSTATRLFDA